LLKYIWTVFEDLMLTVTLVTLMHTVLGRLYGRRGCVAHWIGIGAGLTCSIAVAVMKNTTTWIISSRWNHYTYPVIVGFILAFFVLSLVFGRKDKARWHAGALLACIAGAGLSAVLIYFNVPAVMGYPFNFNTMGQGVMSWYYWERLIGYVLSLTVLLVYARVLAHAAKHIRRVAWPLAALNIGAVSYGVYCAGMFFAPWITRAKWLGWPVKYTGAPEQLWIREWCMFVSRHSLLFIWIAMGLALLLCVFFFLENTAVTEPYDNSAQLRKLRARNRGNRRRAVTAAVCLALVLTGLTAVKAYDTRVITLSAPETYTVKGDKILVPLDLVGDGHLHRFEYRTENNVDIRWIVVKKPGTASFGVGLDACEVCGNAGYYERGGQVVCKRCDVVMNINTIGFKGGCNPIPLSYSYSAEESALVFELSDILAGEKRFK